MIQHDRQQQRGNNSYRSHMEKARRLARYAVSRRCLAGENPSDPNPETLRNVCVGRAAALLYEKFVHSECSLSVVEDVRSDLERLLGCDVVFVIPPTGQLQICTRITQNGRDCGVQPLPDAQKNLAERVLARIIQERVEKGMIHVEDWSA